MRYLIEAAGPDGSILPAMQPVVADELGTELDFGPAEEACVVYFLRVTDAEIGEFFYVGIAEQP